MVLTGKSLVLCTPGFQSVIHLLAIILAVWFTNNIFNADMATNFCAVRIQCLRFTSSVPKTLRMSSKRSIVRPLKLEYLLSILGKTSILPKRYVNSKLDNFTCDCHSERMIMQLVQVVSMRNANINSYVRVELHIRFACFVFCNSHIIMHCCQYNKTFLTGLFLSI